MSYLASTIITRARRHLGDTTEDVDKQQHIDADFFEPITDTLRDAYGINPAIFSTDSIVTDEPTAITAADNSIALDAWTQVPFAHNVASLLMMEDTETEGNFRKAAEHRTLFERGMV